MEAPADRLACGEDVLAARRSHAHVSVYSGPAPPSAGSQPAALGRDRAALDAVRRRDDDLDLARVLAPELVHVRGAHVHPQLGRPRAARVVATRMWLGASSRVLLPLRKTDESLSNVSLPSGVGIARAAVGADERRARRPARSPVPCEVRDRRSPSSCRPARSPSRSPWRTPGACCERASGPSRGSSGGRRRRRLASAPGAADSLARTERAGDRSAASTPDSTA